MSDVLVKDTCSCILEFVIYVCMNKHINCGRLQHFFDNDK